MTDLRVLREKVLADSTPEKAFWACNSSVCRNIYELAECIKGLNEWAFKYHVNTNKNDFAKWIDEVLCDKELAARLSDILDKELYTDIIEQRVKELEEA